MDGKAVLAGILMTVGAGITGWAVGQIQSEAKHQKDLKELADSAKESLRAFKKKWPDTWEQVMKEHENDYDEKFKEELEKL